MPRKKFNKKRKPETGDSKNKQQKRTKPNQYPVTQGSSPSSSSSVFPSVMLTSSPPSIRPKLDLFLEIFENEIESKTNEEKKQVDTSDLSFESPLTSLLLAIEKSSTQNVNPNTSDSSSAMSNSNAASSSESSSSFTGQIVYDQHIVAALEAILVTPDSFNCFGLPGPAFYPNVSAETQYQIGRLYDEYAGKPKLAKQWYQAAGIRNHSRAQNALKTLNDAQGLEDQQDDGNEREPSPVENKNQLPATSPHLSLNSNAITLSSSSMSSSSFGIFSTVAQCSVGDGIPQGLPLTSSLQNNPSSQLNRLPPSTSQQVAPRHKQPSARRKSRASKNPKDKRKKNQTLSPENKDRLPSASSTSPDSSISTSVSSSGMPENSLSTSTMRISDTTAENKNQLPAASPTNLLSDPLWPPERTLEWYHEAAAKGDADAQYQLGTLYEFKKLYGQAINWYSVAAAKNYKKAQNQYTSLRASPDPDVQFQLGQWYALQKDFESAKYYYLLAIGQGHERAKSAYGELIHSFTISQINARAKKIYNEFNQKMLVSSSANPNTGTSVSPSTNMLNHSLSTSAMNISPTTESKILQDISSLFLSPQSFPGSSAMEQYKMGEQYEQINNIKGAIVWYRAAMTHPNADFIIRNKAVDKLCRFLHMLNMDNLAVTPRLILEFSELANNYESGNGVVTDTAMAELLRGQVLTYLAKGSDQGNADIPSRDGLSFPLNNLSDQSDMQNPKDQKCQDEQNIKNVPSVANSCCTLFSISSLSSSSYVKPDQGKGRSAPLPLTIPQGGLD